jgi:hypothetical protein
MLRLLFIAIITLTFTACFSLSYAKQDVACKDHGGVYRYTGEFFTTVSCKDGSTQSWQEITGPEVTEALKLHQGNN